MANTVDVDAILVVVEGALGKPLLWLVAALLVAVLVFGVTMLVRTRGDHPHRPLRRVRPGSRWQGCAGWMSSATVRMMCPSVGCVRLAAGEGRGGSAATR
ncbi:hypothetical protein ACH495_03720 [Micromonospora sp. NPDC018662]|uniref:hypothetical protein n=1 Tax=Micromonospora sp. NPDC018662 TaxID=3364238 RepID=UPI0037B0206E